MTLDDVPTHRVTRSQGRLEVDGGAAGELAERRPGEGLGNGVETQSVGLDGFRSEADAVDRNRAADIDERSGGGCVDLEADP